MKTAKLLVVTTALVLMNAALAAAQVIIQIKPNAAQQLMQTKTNQDDEDLIRAVFDPITEDLRLTPNQKFRIVTIATATMGGAEALFEQLDDLDARLSVAAFSGQVSLVSLPANLLVEIRAALAGAKVTAERSGSKRAAAQRRELLADLVARGLTRPAALEQRRAGLEYERLDLVTRDTERLGDLVVT